MNLTNSASLASLTPDLYVRLMSFERRRCDGYFRYFLQRLERGDPVRNAGDLRAVALRAYTCGLVSLIAFPGSLLGIVAGVMFSFSGGHVWLAVSGFTVLAVAGAFVAQMGTHASLVEEYFRERWRADGRDPRSFTAGEVS